MFLLPSKHFCEDRLIVENTAVLHIGFCRTAALFMESTAKRRENKWF